MRHRLVLPNLSSFRSRGKMLERTSLANELGCDALEIPADLVKSAAEEDLTDRPIGSVLIGPDITRFYSRGEPRTRFILHTDPGIPRRARDGQITMPQLRWDDPDWSHRYGSSVGTMANIIGGELAGVEVHPGKERGGTDRLAAGFVDFRNGVINATGYRPLILVENKHRTRIDRVEDMAEVMDLLPDHGAFGLVVDISNLWKTYRKRLPDAIESVPWERVRALHLHFKHRAPRPVDPVDWDLVFEAINDQHRTLFLNPEVFHTGELRTALAAIRSHLDQRGPPP